MPSANARKHQVPNPTGDAVSRASWVLAPLLSINDIVPVTSTTDRSAVVAGIGYVPSINRPLFVFRADAPAGREVEYTTNGTTWRTVPADDDSGWVALAAPTGFSGNMAYRRRSGWVSVQYVLASTTAAGTNVSPSYIALPAGYRPSRDAFGQIIKRVGTTPTAYVLQAFPTGAVQILNMDIAVGNTLAGSIHFPID